VLLFFSEAAVCFTRLIQQAETILADTGRKYVNDYGFTAAVRKNEASLQKQSFAIVQLLYGLEKITEAKISSMNRAIIISLFIALLFVCLILTAPTIRLNKKSYQKLEHTLEEVKRSEGMLRAVIDSSPDFIFILDREQKYRMVNKALSDAMNLKQEELLGKDDLELGLSSEMVLGDASTGLRGLWADNKEVVETGRIKYIPEETLHLDGTTKIVSMTKVPLKDGQGNIWGLLGFAHDITQRMEAQRIIHESEKKYRHLFFNSPMPMWVYDIASYRFLEVNQMAIQHYGYSAEEFYAMSIFDIRQESEKTRLTDIFNKEESNYEQTYIRGTWRHIKKNGEPIFVTIISHKIDYQGREAMLVLANDVTRQIELQNQLIEEKIVRQKEIAKATIDVQEKERNEIGRELHDNVNQILTSAKLHLECMVNGSAEKHKNIGINLINTAIEEIRKLSKSFVPPSLKDIGLIPSVEDLLETIKATQAIEFEFSCDDFDENHVDNGLKLTIYRIIQEQTTNILKYAEASKIRIELVKQKNRLSLKISDNGRGFDVTQHRKGVGITNMMNRADIYHGDLTIESLPGKGCTLNVVFA
jgi:PAS domain S-box-containing protein